MGPRLRPILGMCLVALTTLGGLAMAFAGPAPRGVPVSAQRAGTCHLAQDPNELAAISSDTAPAVPCTAPHQTETMWVTKVVGPLTQASTRPNGELLDALSSQQCYDYARERAYLGAGPYDVTYGILSWARFPTATAWAAGDRTLACQGSTLTDTPDGPTVDFPLAGVMRTRESARFRLCRGPSGEVTCNRPHDAEELSPNVVLPPGAWPGAQRVSVHALAACQPVARAYLDGPISAHPGLVLTVDPITHAAWDTGNHSANCWLANEHATLTTTTVRGGLS